MVFRFPPRAAVFVATTLTGACAAAAGFAATAPEFGSAAPPMSSHAADQLSGGWREARKETKAEAAKKAADKKAAEEQADAKKAAAKQGGGKSGKPVQVGSFGDWGAFLAEGAKDKTCYALATPKDRAPAKLKRDPAYIFISNRPAEKVRNEVSVIMGFAMKDGGEAKADIGGENFDLVSKGSNAWIKNPAEEAHFIELHEKRLEAGRQGALDKGQCDDRHLLPFGDIRRAGEGSEGLSID